MLNLEIMEAKVKNSSSAGGLATTQTASPLVATGSTTTSWSFNTVPSKKAIDSIVEDQGTSRISTISNHKRVLSSTGNIPNLNLNLANNPNTASKPKLD